MKWASSAHRVGLGGMAGWYVYLLKCADGTRYCGVTTDVSRRLAAHCSGKGAKYTRGRLPVTLLVKSRPLTKSDAHKAEARIKKLEKTRKRYAVQNL